MNLSGERILITGADGFIGSHLAERLVQVGADVHCLALYNSFGSAGWLDTLNDETREQMTIHLGDIRDRDRVDHLVSRVDLVFHLAALISIPYSYVAPRSYVETNIVGTLNVLDSCRRQSSRKLVVASTSEVYGTPMTVPIVENHPIHAQSPYAATKVASDQLSTAFAATYGLNVLVLRPFNTYGPRQSMRAVIPTILAQMLAGREEILLGSLHPRRDFTYVGDTVEAFVKAGESETLPGEVIQLGTGEAVSIEQLVELCRAIVGSSARVVETQERIRPRHSEVQVLLSDPSQALTRLGWSPSIRLEDGLNLTAEWVSKNLQKDESVSQYHL